MLHFSIRCTYLTHKFQFFEYVNLELLLHVVVPNLIFYSLKLIKKLQMMICDNKNNVVFKLKCLIVLDVE